MTTPLGPTPEDIEVYGEVDELDQTIDMAFNTDVGYARVELTFEQTHLLVEAGQLVDESPIAFMHNAALARTEERLAARSDQAESPVAGGS